MSSDTDTEVSSKEDLPNLLGGKRKRGWVFTWNNYSNENYKDLKRSLRKMEVTYLVIGKEVGDSGTPHLQGYVEFKNALRDSTLRKINKKIHWEWRIGTPKEASDYCKKEGNFKEWGNIPSQGKRNDFEEIRDLIKGGAKIKDIAWHFPGQYIRFHKGIEKLYEMFQEDRDFRPQCIWLYGLAGVGKSQFAIRRHGEKNVFIKDEAKWWGSYDHQEAILIDDFDPSEWNFRRFLRLLDKNAYEAETKGGHLKFNSKFIYISCEFPPEKFWSDNKLEQVTTRFTEIIEVKGKNKRAQPKRYSINIDDN